MKCDKCGIDYNIQDMRYNPHENKRYCISCFEEITNRKIYFCEPSMIEKDEDEEE